MSFKFSSFGKGIKRARKQCGLTQEQFASQFTVNGSTISVATVRNWEQGKTYPEAVTLEALCNFFDCDLDYLFARIDCKRHDTQFIQDYTGLDECAIEKLEQMKQNNSVADTATIILINHLINNKMLLRKLTGYYISAFKDVLKRRPYKLIPYNPQKIDQRLFVADIFDALSDDRWTFFRQFESDPYICKQMSFELIWRSVDDSQAISLLQVLYEHRMDEENDSQLAAIAEFLNSDNNYRSLAQRLEVDLEKFYTEGDIKDGITETKNY